jgi:tripartite-type tricarboxylate transporter receptor subunit TctC
MKAGRVTLLAIGGKRRFNSLPEVPLLDEVGLADMPGGGWWGVFMPAATPEPMVMRINGEIVRLFREPRFAEFLESQLVEIDVSSPEEFAAFIRRERERTAELARRYNISPQ